MRRLLCLGSILILAFFALSAAHASYVYPWAPAPLLVDPTGDAFQPSADIQGVWWARDGNLDYWRFDLPTSVQATPGDFYGAFIDITAGSFWPPSGLPPGVPYADVFVGVEYTNMGGSYAWTPIASAPPYLVFNNPIVQGQATENGGQTVEFRIDSTQGAFKYVPRDYLWSGVSGNTADPPFFSTYSIYDYTDARNTANDIDTPEPATLVLLPLGCGLVLRRLRRRRQ